VVFLLSDYFVRYTIYMKKIMSTDSVRSFVFGVEDSLVSTIGLVSGIAAVGTNRSVIILTGLILIAVEAFSMAVGTLLSDNSADEYKSGSSVSYTKAVVPALIMFVSYIVAGILVLLPYLGTNNEDAFVQSIVISLIALFLLGILSAQLSKLPLFKKGITMVCIGGVAILIGVGVGSLINGFL
jgi:VIT1/CCC1 family predicted Fe2+/Mn2+ transporter